MTRAALLLVLLSSSGCGGSGGPPKLVTETVGQGPQTATIVRPDVDGRVPVVLFLHGWGATRPRFYQPWLDHLAREGNAVIYPRYQDSFVDQPSEVLGNALAGVRLALKRIDAKPGSLVVAGHSAGGALAADYAAIARTAKLPVPVAVFSAYPGRTLRRVNVGIPEIDPARIPRDTEVVALAGSERPRGREPRRAPDRAQHRRAARARDRPAGVGPPRAPARDRRLAPRVLGPARRADRARPRLSAAADREQVRAGAEQARLLLHALDRAQQLLAALGVVELAAEVRDRPDRALDGEHTLGWRAQRPRARPAAPPAGGSTPW